MAALWKVRVVTLEDCQAILEVIQIHPDAGAFNDDPTFALRMLHEEAWKFEGSFEYTPLGTLGKEVSIEQQYDPVWMAEHTSEFISQVELKANRPTLDEAAVLQIVMARLFLSGNHGDLNQEDQERVETAYQDYWSNPANLPKATYIIHVEDPSFLEHLHVGMEWRSAAY